MDFKQNMLYTDMHLIMKCYYRNRQRYRYTVVQLTWKNLGRNNGFANSGVLRCKCDAKSVWARRWKEKSCAQSLEFSLLSEDCSGCFAALVFHNPFKKCCFWPFNLNLKTPSPKHSSESRSICSHLFYGNELFPSFPWLLTQPVTATCKPLHREGRKGEEGEDWSGRERERERKEKDNRCQWKVGVCGEEDPTLCEGEGVELEERYEWCWYRCLQLEVK